MMDGAIALAITPRVILMRAIVGIVVIVALGIVGDKLPVDAGAIPSASRLETVA